MKRPSALLLALCAARLLCAQEAASAPFRVDTAQTAPAAAPIRGQQVTALSPSPLWTLDLLSLYLASDHDGDGLPDAWETAHGLNPDNPADATEATLAAYNAGRDPSDAVTTPILGTPFRVDTTQTAPTAAPIRGQQVTAIGPSPLWTLDLLSLYLASDLDGDGLPDAWETAHGLNPDDPADATEATLAAYNAGRDPTDATTTPTPVAPVAGTPFRVDTSQTAPPAKSAQLIFRVAVSSGNFICDTGGYFVSTTGSELPDWFVAQYAPAGTSFTAEDDTDGDGLSNYAEFVLGTNPTDPTSRFTLSLTSPAPSTRSTTPTLTLSWNSVTGRTYTVLTRTALDVPWESTPLAILPGTGSPLSLTLSQDAPTRFYCVQVDFE
ncbi:MAG: thrombospondin type 3 repeat-containing protein [Candidatus Spyradenecus sp.]